jgi:hypothetical protein
MAESVDVCEMSIGRIVVFLLQLSPPELIVRKCWLRGYMLLF